MKIGVISDTHIPIFAAKLPKRVYDCFKGCDLIIHVGDAVEMSVINELKKIAETKAVCGNMDSAEIKKNMPDKLLLEVAGKKIGVMHGRGPGFNVMQLAGKVFKGKADIVIFGHSHVPCNEKKDGVLFFNPGSATDRACPHKCSFGMIEITGDDVKAEIIACEG